MAANDLKKELQKLGRDLKQGADEVRLKLHLAGKDAKDVWDKLEPQLSSFEKKVGDATTELGQEMSDLGTDLKEKMRSLLDKLGSSLDSTAKPAVVEDYMTACPKTLGREQPLAQAHEFMRQGNYRHLPVLHGGKLVGVVSLGDLAWIESLEGVDLSTLSVEEAMSADPYTMDCQTPLLDAAIYMRDHHIGSALVERDGKLAGIFTHTDALRALCDALSGKI